jgi:hypothetical protein
MMEYSKVFDVVEAGYKSRTFPAFGLIFVAIGAILLIFRRQLALVWGKSQGQSNGFAVFFFGFAVLWTITSFLATSGQYMNLRQALETGQASVVEGTVSQFTPMPAAGHSKERFCVKDRCFEYSDFIITGGFNNTSSHGGPIYEGLPVRVTYVGDTIVRLEIKR